MTENRKYFHINSKGEVKEITGDEWFHIVQLRNQKKLKFVASKFKGEITFDKGDNHIFIRERELLQILKEAKV